MSIIYEPTGEAREYVPLAANPYQSCSHKCKYCYCPQVLKVGRETFHGELRLKKNWKADLKKDAGKLQGDKREILLSFVGDPYQPAETELHVTRKAIRILMENKLRFTILTKGGTRAVPDFDILELARYKKARFGTSLVFTKQADADEWEPGAAPIQDRIEAIREAHWRGIPTWVSLEPVIDPEQALELIRMLHPIVGHWKVGKLNHHTLSVDWLKFRQDVTALLDSLGADYYIKKSLIDMEGDHMEKTLPSKRGWVATNRLKRRPPFKGLFPIRQETMQAVAEHMEANGYDESAPIVVWDQTAGGDKHALVVLDGHTRLEAAKSINLSPVYVARMEFTDEEAALQYAIHNQRDRRNLTDADIMRCIEAVDKLKRQGERTDLASSDAKSGKSAEETAKVVGTSTRKVEKVRTITAHADEETKAAVVAGRKSINKAYQETQRERKPKERQADDTPVNFFPNLQPKPAPPPEPVKNPLEQVFDHLWAAWQVIEKEWPQGERREYPELRVRFGRGRSPDFRWDGDGLNGEQTTAVRVRILLSDIANHNEPFHDFLRDTVTTPPATTEAVMVTCQRNGGDQMALSHCLNECRHRAECSTVKAHIQ